MKIFKSWAAALCVAVSAAACGGGGGDAEPSIGVTFSPATATLNASTTDVAPSTVVAMTATNMPAGGLYVAPDAGARGYVTTDFNGYGVVVTGDRPGSFAPGSYTDTISVRVCYDAQCARQIAGSPLKLPVTYTITKGDPATATPTLVALSPASVTVGSAGFTLVVSGANFVPTSTVLWNGIARATTYVSESMLSVQVNASDVAYIASAYVTVSNASTGGGTSTGLSLSVAAPTPAISAVSPAGAATGGSAYVLTVKGTGFDSSSQVSWNGSARTTTYVSPTQLTAQITAQDIAASGNFPVTVANLDSGAVSSGAFTVTVAPAPLALNGIAPTFVAAGGPAYMEILTGTGFDATSTVQWNGSARAATLLSTTQLKVQVSAADIASVGSATLQVVNTGAHAGTSATQVLTIVKPSTDATAYQINPQHNGAIRFANVVPASAFPLSPAWTATLDGTASYPLIAGGRVFVTLARSNGGSALVALSAATGAVVWGPIAIAGSVNATYDDGRVMVMSSGGVMTGFDAATGNQLWSTLMPYQYLFSAPPTAANGMVFTGGSGSGGTLYGVNDATGALVWSASVMNGMNSAPTLTSDGVYVTYPCQTYDFQPQTGAIVWHDNGPCEGGGGATGAFGNGVYYSPNGVGTPSETFDAETGALLSTYGGGLPPALGLTTGYFVQNGTLDAVGLSNNAIRWTFAGDIGISAAPILVNDYLFVASGSGKLYALDAASGVQLWQAALGGTVNAGGYSQLGQSGMAAGDGLLLVPVGNTLTAYTLSNSP